jgi:hypothetical protein
MNNYKEYFQTLKFYLITLDIDKRKGIVGCKEEEIKTLIEKKGKLPLAYEEYLRSIGKFFLFDFMDAEDMSYEHIDYITEFGDEVFEANNFKPSRPLIVISERRNDYISLIHTDEGDNPKVWIMSEYWDENEKGKNLTVRKNSFTDLIDIFFIQTLSNHTAGFHFVSSEIPEYKIEKHIQKLYSNWIKSLKKIKETIDNYSGDNTLVMNLNKIFNDYYFANESFINQELNNSKISNHKPLEENKYPEKNKSFFQKILNIFK